MYIFCQKILKKLNTKSLFIIINKLWTEYGLQSVDGG